jgi:hypothetical protein
MFVSLQPMTKLSDDDYNNVYKEINIYLANSFVAGQNLAEKEVQKELLL